MLRTSFLRTISGWLAPIALAACATETTPERYYDVTREIRLQTQRPEGAFYAKEVFRKTITDYERVARSCAVHERDRRPVELLYQLDAQGRVVDSILHPDTPLARCIHEKLGLLEAFSLPPPPHDDYWVRVPGFVS